MSTMNTTWMERALTAAERDRDEAQAELDALRRRIEAWIRHGEAVPPNVTTYDRALVNAELRQIISP